MARRVLIDTREFVKGRYTGIRRVLEGLIDALAQSSAVEELILTESDTGAIPVKLKKQEGIRIQPIPSSFVASEKALSNLTKKGIHLFISPYPKLPLFGTACPAVHVIHDVLDLTHPAYKKRFKARFDKFRLKKALREADLTWYMSNWSMEETKRLVGFVGKNPRVRYSGVAESFDQPRNDPNERVLKRYGVHSGSILVIGNGMPHKNLGVLLRISGELSRPLAFIGVSGRNQAYWKAQYATSQVRWLDFIDDEDIPALMKSSFCLAQPSTAEGYGYPPLEAMACGIPVVVSNIPVLKETTGGNAILVDPEDSGKWKEAFASLEDTEIYEKMVESGMGWVRPLRGRNCWQKHISDIKELLRDCRKTRF